MYSCSSIVVEKKGERKVNFSSYLNLICSQKGTITRGTVVKIEEDRIVLKLKEYEVEGFILKNQQRNNPILSSLKTGDVIEVAMDELHEAKGSDPVMECSVSEASAVISASTRQEITNSDNLSDEDLLLHSLQMGETEQVKELLKKGITVALKVDEIPDGESVFFRYKAERRKRLRSEAGEIAYILEVFQMLLSASAFQEEEEFWSGSEHLTAFVNNAVSLYPKKHNFAVRLCSILLAARTEQFQGMDYEIENVNSVEMLQLFLKYGAVIPDSVSEPEKAWKLLLPAVKAKNQDLLEELLKHSDYSSAMLTDALGKTLQEEKAELLIRKGAVLTPQRARALFRYTKSVPFAEKLLREGADAGIEFNIGAKLADRQSLEMFRMLLSYDRRKIQDTFKELFKNYLSVEELEILFEKGLTVYDTGLDFSAVRKRYPYNPRAVILLLENGVRIDPASEEIHDWIWQLLPHWKAVPTGEYTFGKVHEDAEVEILKKLYYICPMAIRLAGAEAIVLKLIFGEDVFKNRCRDSIPEDAVTVIIPENVAEISAGTFKNHTKMKRVIIHEWVTSIGNEAFEGCEALEEVIFEKYRVGFIGRAAFKNCKNLRAITIGGETMLSEEAFMNCERLSKIEHSASEDMLKPYDGDSGTADNKIVWGKCAFANCKSLKEIEGFCLDRIEDRCFDGCSSLYRFDMQINTRIGDFAFRGCYALEQIRLTDDDDWDTDWVFHMKLGKLPFPCKEYERFSAEGMCFEFEHPEDIEQYPDETRRILAAYSSRQEKSSRYDDDYRYVRENLEEKYNYDEDAMESSPDYWDRLY